MPLPARSEFASSITLRDGHGYNEESTFVQTHLDLIDIVDGGRPSLSEPEGEGLRAEGRGRDRADRIGHAADMQGQPAGKRRRAWAWWASGASWCGSWALISEGVPHPGSRRAPEPRPGPLGVSSRGPFRGEQRRRPRWPGRPIGLGLGLPSDLFRPPLSSSAAAGWLGVGRVGAEFPGPSSSRRAVGGAWIDFGDGVDQNGHRRAPFRLAVGPSGPSQPAGPLLSPWLPSTLDIPYLVYPLQKSIDFSWILSIQVDCLPKSIDYNPGWWWDMLERDECGRRIRAAARRGADSGPRGGPALRPARPSSCPIDLGPRPSWTSLYELIETLGLTRRSCSRSISDAMGNRAGESRAEWDLALAEVPYHRQYRPRGGRRCPPSCLDDDRRYPDRMAYAVVHN